MTTMIGRGARPLLVDIVVLIVNDDSDDDHRGSPSPPCPIINDPCHLASSWVGDGGGCNICCCHPLLLFLI
jgi:hypothetical protein